MSLAALAFVLASAAALLPAPARAEGPVEPDWLDRAVPDLLQLYQHLHAHPELSFLETATARRIAEELGKTGAQATSGVGKLGVVGVLKNGPGPLVLVRTDMDALPVVKETGLPYASTVKAKGAGGRDVGVMHACGHDIHMSTFVGVARWLAEHKDRWSGTVLLVAQPAEETVGGARGMLGDGLYTRFGKPDYALALHCDAGSPTGTVRYLPGPMLASSTSVEIIVRGKGGHGAWPHRTVDPIVLAALMIVDLQTIVSREVSPLDPSVVTVGSIHGGAKHNIIPNEVKLQLTLRSFSEPVRQQLIAGIDRRVKALARAHQAPAPSIAIQESVPPTVNAPELVERLVPAFQEALGAANVQRAEPVMGAEDFGLFSRDGVPICRFWLGTIDRARMDAAKAGRETLPALHSSKYRPDPGPSIRTGVQAMTAAVVRLLPPSGR